MKNHTAKTALLRTVLCAAATFAAAAPLLRAAEPEVAAPHEATDRVAPDTTSFANDETLPTPGLRAYYDPVTRTYSASGGQKQIEELSKALAGALSRSVEGLETFGLDDGGHGVHLDGRFQSATVVMVNEDGSASFRCVHDAEQVEDQSTGRHDPTTRYEDM